MKKKDLMQGVVHKLRLQNLAFFDHLPPFIYIFYGMKGYKKSIFLTTYLVPLVNVVCERPQSRNQGITRVLSYEHNCKVWGFVRHRN